MHIKRLCFIEDTAVVLKAFLRDCYQRVMSRVTGGSGNCKQWHAHGYMMLTGLKSTVGGRAEVSQNISTQF